MQPIHLVEGPVGAGNSRRAGELARQLPGAHLALDDWFVPLYSPDRPAGDFVPWYMQRKARLVALMWAHVLAIAQAGVSFILELGLIQRRARAARYERAQQAGAVLRIQVLDASEAVRRERVERRHTPRAPTFAMPVSRAVFERASALWEPPDEDEIRAQGIICVHAPSP